MQGLEELVLQLGDFLRSTHNCLYQAICWHRVVEYDGVGHCLPKYQSCILRNFHIEPMKYVLMPFPFRSVWEPFWADQWHAVDQRWGSCRGPNAVKKHVCRPWFPPVRPASKSTKQQQLICNPMKPQRDKNNQSIRTEFPRWFAVLYRL